MNKKEYKEYQIAVNNFFEAEGIGNLSSSPETEECGCGNKAWDDMTDDEKDCEPFFSWSSCDCCRSNLGGNRHHATGYNATTKQIYCYSICDDCVYYAEYGRLDDQTMMEVESE